MGKLLIAIFISSSVFANISVISDLDDTIKRTHSKHPVGIVNALLTRKVYGGMPEVINLIKGNIEVNKLHILSASPRMFKKNIVALLKKFKIQYDSLKLRNLKTEKEKFKYKYNYISSLINSTSDRYILIGDNIGDDPEIYAKVREDYPSRVEAIYIHKVTSRKLSSSFVQYFTSYDLALLEYSQNRISRDNAVSLGQRILSEQKLKNYFPKQVYCPRSRKEFSHLPSAEFKAISERITQRILDFCI